MKAELSHAGVELDERDFFADPFSADELRALIGERSAADFFSWRSPSFRKLGIDRASLSEERMIELMVEEPRLIRRPLIRTEGGALIAGNDKAALARLTETGGG